MSNTSKNLIKEYFKHKTLLTISIVTMFFAGMTSILPSWFVKVSIDGLAALQNGVGKFNVLPQQVINWLSNQNFGLSLENFTIDVTSLRTVLPFAIVSVFFL